MFELTYAHCTSAKRNSDGRRIDQAPLTQYEHRTVAAEMFRVAPDWRLSEKFDTFQVKVNGKIVAWGDTKEEALSCARYHLMDESREAAFNAA